MRIHWVNTNPGASRDEAGYWASTEGRFDISPNYRHTIYPDSYTEVDHLVLDPTGRSTQFMFDRVRDCKAWAEQRAAETLVKNNPTLDPKYNRKAVTS